MRKAFIVIMVMGLFVSCEKSNDSKETSQNKKTLDSLAHQKESRTDEINELNSELDSLRRLSDSLKAISE